MDWQRFELFTTHLIDDISCFHYFIFSCCKLFDRRARELFDKMNGYVWVFENVMGGTEVSTAFEPSFVVGLMFGKSKSKRPTGGADILLRYLRRPQGIDTAVSVIGHVYFYW